MTNTLLETREIVKEKKAFLFDFDGTLANLDNLNVDSFTIILKESFDLDFTREDFMKYVSGRGSKDGLTKYLTCKGIKDFDVEELSKDFSQTKRKLINENLEEEVYIIPGLENFLEYLKKENKRMVVVTSSNYDYVKVVLEHFGLFDYFEKVYDRGTVEKSKPDPEMFLQAIEYTGLDNEDCLAFEDSLFGLKSAKGANLFTIGILNDGWNDEFVYDLADIVIESYDELLEE
jgi:HAD superfamily hydrolase (TIGR01509 family)